MFKKCIISILVFGTVQSSVDAQQQKKPNILMIAIDDLKPMLGCYGESRIITPNIDALAARGTVFLKNYCQQAVCAPTRASLMTGLRPDGTKVWDLKTQLRDMVPNVVTMPQYFVQQGYATTGIGKVFDVRSVDKQLDAPSWSIPYQKLNDDDYAKGYEKPVGGQYQAKSTLDLLAGFEKEAKDKGLNEVETKDFMDKHLVVVEAGDVPDDAYSDGAIARKAGKILASLKNQDKPFFLAVGFSKPHLPFVSPKKYWDKYDRNSIQLAAFQQLTKGAPQYAFQPSAELVNNYALPDGSRFKADYALQSEEAQRMLIHGYYAAVSYTDEQVGYLLAQLKQLGLDNNTIVVLWGDHGWHLGDHGIWNKHTNFEQATRAPLIIAAPGFKGGQQAQGLSEFVDVFPTLCELSGIPKPSGLAGTSLAPVLKNPQTKVKDIAQSQYPRGDQTMGYALRSDRYRCVIWYKENFRNQPVHQGSEVIAVELYDYEKDPLEKVNLATDAGYAEVLSLMKSKINAYLSKKP